MSLAPIAPRFSFVAVLTGLFLAIAVLGAGGGCSLNTAGIGTLGPVTDGTGGTGSESRGGVGGNISVLTGSGGSTVVTGAGGAGAGTGGSGDAGANGAGGAIVPGSGGSSVTGAGGAHDGAGGMQTGAGGMQTGAGGMINGSGGASAGGSGMGGSGMGGSGMGGSGMGGSGMGGARGMGGAPGMGGMQGTGGISVIGCADGTREAFVSVTNFPSIAGCDGGWSIAGVVSMASMTPACNRAAGNDGTKPNGNGCSVADLCAVGWHVCAGANELDDLNVTCGQAGIPNATNAASSRLLYATRQRGVTGLVCNANDMIGTNDVHGCGNFGLAEDPNCAPLNRQFSHTECDQVSPWSCTDAVLATTEGLVVVKPGSAGGGVLCCK